MCIIEIMEYTFVQEENTGPLIPVKDKNICPVVPSKVKQSDNTNPSL